MNQLQVTKQLQTDGTWSITGSLVAGSTLPTSVFIYENTGTTSLGNYVGVCSIDELKFQEFKGTIIKVFGNKYIRYGVAKISMPSSDDADAAIANMTSTLKSLAIQVAASGNSTQVITIS